MRYRFGEFELDGGAYTLTRSGVELPLQRKVFDLLRHLVERPGQVVTKGELLEALWRGEHVNEGAVPWTVFHARRALGQERGDRAPIETVQGRGYRLLAEVTVEASEAPALESAARAPSQATPSALPFVGRAEVMTRLESRLRQALSGGGGVCLLVGEAGIGKTRCAEELRAAAARAGARTWSGRSVEGLGAPVFWPWIQVMRDALRESPELRDAAEPLLARMAALDGADAAPHGPATRASRFWVLDGVSRFLLDAAARAPVVIALEDLHWADAATLELVAFLLPELGRSSLFVVGTMRREPHELDQRCGERLARAERIELPRLSEDDVTRYIRELVRVTPSAELSAAVHRASAGNPLFLQETVRALVAEHGADKLASLEPAAVTPAQVARDVLRPRLAALGQPALGALACASVLGESFDLGVLQRLRGDSLESLLESLESACDAGLLESDGPHSYRFAHALLRSILYDDMPSAERVATHRRAAELLTELGPRPRRSEVALHFYRSLPAGDFPRVVSAAKSAADAAAHVQAFEDAVTYYLWALEAQGFDATAGARARADLLFALGSAERLAGRYEDSRRTLAKVVSLGQEHGFADLLLRAARALRPTHAVSTVPDKLVRGALEEVLRLSGDSPDVNRVGALSLLACVPPYSTHMARNDELSAEAVALARKLGDSAALSDALCARLHSLSGPDRIGELLATADELLGVSGQGGWLKGEAHTARLGAQLQRGDIAAVDTALRELELAAHESRFPEAIWFHDRIRNQRRILDGDFPPAKEVCKELGRRAKRMGLSYGVLFTAAQTNAIAFAERGLEAVRDWNVAALFAIGDDMQPSFRAELVAISAQLGREREARSMFEVISARGYDDLPKDLGWLNALVHLSRAAVCLGDFARAERLYERLTPYAGFNTPNAMLFYEGTTSHALAALAAALGRDAPAEAHFAAALRENERLGARPHLARTCLDYARWLARRRGAGAARPVAARARHIAAELQMDWLAREAAPLAG